MMRSVRARRGTVIGLPSRPDTSRVLCRIRGSRGQLGVSDASLRVSDRRRNPGGDRFQAGRAEAIDVALAQRGELRLAELHVAAPAAEQAPAVEAEAAFRAALFFGEDHHLRIYDLFSSS